MWKVILSKKAQQDLELLSNIGLYDKVKGLVALLRENPFISPPNYGRKFTGLLFPTYQY